MTHARRSLPRWLQQWWIWFTAIFAITFVSFWTSFFSAIVNIETHIIVHGDNGTADGIPLLAIKAARRRDIPLRW